MRRTIIVLLVLAGLLVGADFAAAAVAESVVSRQMREQIGLADDPSVRINGFPFLTQALSGRYSSVDVDAQHITVGGLKDLRVAAQLNNVYAPLSMLLSSGEKTLKVGAAQGSVQIPAKDIERLVNRNSAARIEDLRVDPIDAAGLRDAIAQGGDRSLTTLDPEKAVRLTGTTTLPLLGKNEVSVIGVLELAGGKAKIVPRDVRFGDTRLPSAVGNSVEQLFSLSLDPGSLPLRVTPTALQAVNGALQVSGTAADLVLGGAAPARPAG